MLSQVILHLNIELDQTVHGAKDCSSFENLDPDVRKLRVIRTYAVPAQSLGYD